MGFPRFWKAYTPPIRTANGALASESVASLSTVNLSGSPQWILVRGENRRNPIVLFLHGGPGMPLMYLAHRFQRPLERDFVVVHWDRRGAGKTFTADTSPAAMSVSQEVQDARELVNHLRSQFSQPKVYLVGHSYGSYLGTILAQRYPELFYAYVGVGPLVDRTLPKQEMQDRWLREQAQLRGKQKLVRDLDAHRAIDRERWIFRFGGGLHSSKSFLTLIRIGLGSPEYSLGDSLKVTKGVNFTQRYLRYDAIEGELAEAVPRVEIPIYFFVGRFDYTTPSELAVEYSTRLNAPRKEIVWFEGSAHFPFLEEPEKFTRELNRVRDETAA